MSFSEKLFARERDLATTIEIEGGEIVHTRGTVVTYRQKCSVCGHAYPYNKTTIVPAYGVRSCRPFTCPECGHYQEVNMKYLGAE